MEKIRQDQTLEPKQSGGGGVLKLGEQEIDLIHHLKTTTLLMPYANILKLFEQTAVLSLGTSEPAIGKVVVNKLQKSDSMYV